MSPSMRERWFATPLFLGEAGAWDGHRAWDGFAGWCEAHAGHACRLWLSSSWLLELSCDADLPLRDDEAALAWARPLLQHYHGDAAAAWPLAAWQQGQRRGVSAMPGVSLEALQAAAARHRVRLRAVCPWWSLVLRRALPRSAALRARSAELLVVEGSRVAALALARGRLQSVQIRRLEAADAQALTRWCAEQAPQTRVAAGYGLLGPVAGEIASLGALDGRHPPAAWLAAGSA